MSWMSLNYKIYLDKHYLYLLPFNSFLFKESSIVTIKYVFSFFWSLNCTSLVCKLFIQTILDFWAVFISEIFWIKTFILDISEILDNIIGSYLLILLNIFYRRSTAILFGAVLFDTFSRLRELLSLKKIFSKSSYIYFFYPKTSNFHNSGMVVRTELPDLSMNNIFNVLSTGLHGLKCRVT